MYHKGYRMKAKVSQIGTEMDALTQGHKIKQEPEGAFGTLRDLNWLRGWFHPVFAGLLAETWAKSPVYMMHLHSRLTFTCCMFGVSLNLVKQSQISSPMKVCWLCRACLQALIEVPGAKLDKLYLGIWLKASVPTFLSPREILLLANTCLEFEYRCVVGDCSLGTY